MNAATGHLWTILPLILHLRRTEKAKRKRVCSFVFQFMRWQKLWNELKLILHLPSPLLLLSVLLPCHWEWSYIKINHVAAAMIEFENFRHCSSAAKWDQPKPIKRLPSSALDNMTYTDMRSLSYCKLLTTTKRIHEMEPWKYFLLPSGMSLCPATTVWSTACLLHGLYAGPDSLQL